MNIVIVQFLSSHLDEEIIHKYGKDHVFVINPLANAISLMQNLDVQVFPLNTAYCNQGKWDRLLRSSYVLETFKKFRIESLLALVLLWFNFNNFVDTVLAFNPRLILLKDIAFPSLIRMRLQQRHADWKILITNIPENYKIKKSIHRIVESDRKVSIVLPVYNGEEYLEEAILSCLRQNYENIELVIVNDGSSDHTDYIIKKLAKEDNRIVTCNNAVNKGLPYSLNIGFSITSGSYLTWTSHDNYLSEDAIYVLASFLREWDDVSFVYSAYYNVIVDEPRSSDLPEIVYLPPPCYLSRGNAVGPYFMFRRDVYDRVGSFREDMEYLEDYDYWVRVYLTGHRMVRLHLPHYFYRRHHKSLTYDARFQPPEFWMRVQKEYFY